jgi:hypothetical protein
MLCRRRIIILRIRRRRRRKRKRRMVSTRPGADYIAPGKKREKKKAQYNAPTVWDSVISQRWYVKKVFAFLILVPLNGWILAKRERSNERERERESGRDRERQI